MLRSLLAFLAGDLKDWLINELERQGHTATNDLLNSIEVAINEIGNGFEITGEYLYYGRFVDTGRRAGTKKVPISALLDWIRVKKIDLRGNSEKSVAFAIQTAIFKKGIPTDGDKSKLRWMSGTLEAKEEEIDKRVREIAGTYVDTVFDNMIENTKKLFTESTAA